MIYFMEIYHTYDIKTISYVMTLIFWCETYHIESDKRKIMNDIFTEIYHTVDIKNDIICHGIDILVCKDHNFKKGFR